MSNDDDKASQFDAELDAAAQEEAVVFDSLDDLLADLNDSLPTGDPNATLRRMRDDERH